MNFEELKNVILSDCTETANVPLEVIEEDFLKFCAEIDRVIEETGVDEDSAIIAVMDSWVFPGMEEV